jgi:hypothetical protein
MIINSVAYCIRSLECNSEFHFVNVFLSVVMRDEGSNVTILDYDNLIHITLLHVMILAYICPKAFKRLGINIARACLRSSGKPIPQDTMMYCHNQHETFLFYLITLESLCGTKGICNESSYPAHESKPQFRV